MRHGKVHPISQEVLRVTSTHKRSNSTGTPKAVLASHANLTHGWTAQPRHRPPDRSRHVLHGFPLGTNAAQTMLSNALVAAPAPAAVMVPRHGAQVDTAGPGPSAVVG